MATYSNSLNAALAAIISNFSGATAPSTTGQPATNQWWVDNSASPPALKMYDGSTWAVVGYISTAQHIFTPVQQSTAGVIFSTADLTGTLSHYNRWIGMNLATTNRFILPTSTTVNYPIGTEIDVMRYGAGITTIVPVSTVTITMRPSSALNIGFQYGQVKLKKIGTDEWAISGNYST